MNYSDNQSYFNKKTSILLGKNLLDFSVAKVMGILNITSDSFFDGGKYENEKSILHRIIQIVTEGADIIDVGGFSSRPGAKAISETEEFTRIDKALKIIRNNFPELPVSIDTFRSQIVRKVVENYGSVIVNDISAGTFDEKMLETVSLLHLPIIMMHIQGKPENMQENPLYFNVVNEIIAFFVQRVQKCKELNISDYIIDPGFGFGKTIDHNYELLDNLNAFSIFEVPVLVGLSRKSMIFRYLNVSPDEALTGTIALNTIALQKGADILRVHDVKEACEVVKIISKLKVSE